MIKQRAFNLKGKVLNILENHPETQHTSFEIAEKILQYFPEDCGEKRDRTTVRTDKELIAQISSEIGAVWRNIVNSDNRVRTIETRPRLFYFSSSTEEEEVVNENSIFDTSTTTDAPDLDYSNYSEHDLYPKLGMYIYQELNCVSMRINEARSSNSRGKGGNHWLFPDVVGMINLSDGWHQEVTELADSLSTKKVRLCSFEVKKTVNRSNVREVVFQTVSNSSWANLSYLVAAKLESKAIEELRMLCLAHGVGFINLDVKTPHESQILIPAKFRDKINYDSLDRLVSENKDAENYLEYVTTFLKTKKLRESFWDLVPKHQQ